MKRLQAKAEDLVEAHKRAMLEELERRYKASLEAEAEEDREEMCF